MKKTTILMEIIEHAMTIEHEIAYKDMIFIEW